MRTRNFLAAVLLLFSSQSFAGTAYNAVVDQDGGDGAEVPVFRSIGAALDAAPSAAKQTYVIYIRAGRYREKLTVDKPNITLIGESRENTLLTYDAYAGQQMPGSDETWGTFRSATLSIRAPDFRAQNLTIQNNFDFIANDALENGHPQKIRHTQAVALTLDEGSDRAAFQKVRLSGYQDTLYAKSGRSFFLDSIIEGNVDFIFGAGQAVFKDSDIITRGRGRPVDNIGYVTAPSTNIDDRYGLVFLNCRLLREEGVPDNSTPLGRPWHPTTNFPDGRYADPDAIGASVFIRTYMDAHIASDGWASMRGTSRDGTKSTVFEPEGARFYEYQSSGPGAADHPLRRQLSKEEAGKYTLSDIFGDWKPKLYESN